MTGRLICAWCQPNHDMGPAESVKDSHGMCERAAAVFEATFEREVTDHLGEPIG